MSDCHHIDWSGLEIVINAKNGAGNLTYQCLLCERVFNQEEYKELINEIKQKKKDKKLDTWRTPRGELHTLEECPDTDNCEIHEGKEQ